MKIFHIAFILSTLLIISCTNTETTDSTLGSPTEEKINSIPLTDSIPLTNEKTAETTEVKDGEKPVKKKPENQVIVKKETSEKPVKETSDSQDPEKEETVKKPQPVKTKTFSFIFTDVGKQVADDYKGDLMTNAATEVYLEKKGVCENEDCGKKIIAVNMNKNKSIEVVVLIGWKENDEKINKKRSYNLKSSQKIEIGCSLKCDAANTNIKWNIIGATYID
jgi:hypothetical protein